MVHSEPSAGNPELDLDDLAEPLLEMSEPMTVSSVTSLRDGISLEFDGQPGIDLVGTSGNVTPGMRLVLFTGESNGHQVTKIVKDASTGDVIWSKNPLT